MSQAKVDQYKKEKATRKKTIARQKIQKKVTLVCVLVLFVAAVSFGTYRGVTNYYKNLPAETFSVNLSGVSDYLNSLGK